MIFKMIVIKTTLKSIKLLNKQVLLSTMLSSNFIIIYFRRGQIDVVLVVRFQLKFILIYTKNMIDFCCINLNGII